MILVLWRFIGPANEISHTQKYTNMNTNSHEKLLHKELSYQVQGMAFEVRRSFGRGLKESIYQNAFAEELEARNIQFEKEKSIQVFSPKTGKLVGSYRPDFIVDEKIIVELKAVEKIPKMFLDQLYSYLRNSKYELGYFINFASPKLYMKRLIFTNDRKPFLQDTQKDRNIERIVTKTSCLLVFLFVLFSVFAPLAQAGEIRLDAQKSELNSGEQFLVNVVIHSEESLNAIEGRLIFPQDLLSIKEIRDGNSVINFWVEKPRVESSGVVLFSGITPGGFNGANNVIFSIVFEAKNIAENISSASISLQNTKALKNDGLGTESILSTRDTTVSIKHGDSNVRKEILIDTELPEDFNPTIESSPNIFNGKYFLVFATQDKSSGIDHYEVREGDWGWFRVAESPSLLRYQSLDRKIFVKAIDKIGNERIAVLGAKLEAPWYRQYEFLGILLGIIVVGFLLKKLWRRVTK